MERIPLGKMSTKSLEYNSVKSLWFEMVIGPSAGGFVTAFISYFNPFTAALAAVGTVVIAGIAYKYSKAPPCKDFEIPEGEEICDPVVEASDRGHHSSSDPDDQGHHPSSPPNGQGRGGSGEEGPDELNI